MFIVRWFFTLLVLAALAFGVAYYMAGNADGPAITINQPSIIGQGGTLDVTIDAPAAELSAVSIQIEQKGRMFPVLDVVSPRGDGFVIEGDRVRVTRPVGKKTLPELESGRATVKVRASRPVLRGLRRVSSEASREAQVGVAPLRHPAV